jgi:predicted transposase YdaD
MAPLALGPRPFSLQLMLHQLTPLEETRSYKIIFGRGESKGKGKGKAEGMAEGKAEGKADSLERLLRHRFGPLPDRASARISAAELSQLDAWLDAVLDIHGIEELLGPAP